MNTDARHPAAGDIPHRPLVEYEQVSGRLLLALPLCCATRRGGR
jgi:hypothetical protein